MNTKFNFQLKSPKRTNVLVFDEITCLRLKNPILKTFNFEILPIRKKKICFGIKIWMYFFLNLKFLSWKFIFSRSFSYKYIFEQFFVIYIIAWIKCVNPKLVITFIDNSWYFQRADKILKDIIFFTIQNGMRSKVSLTSELQKPPHPGSSIFISNYFSFGKNEKKLYKNYGHTILNHYPTGSVILSYFLKNFKVKFKNNIFKFLLISQWDEIIMLGTLYPEIKESIIKFNILMSKYLRLKKDSINILLRTNNQMEKDFYKSFFKNNVNFIYSNHDNMTSYHTICNSEIIFSLDSTLGLEAYAVDKKVLFVNLTSSKNFKTNVHDICYLSKNEFKLLKKKIEFLLHINDNLYKDLICDTKNFLISYKVRKVFSHDFIIKSMKDVLYS